MSTEIKCVWCGKTESEHGPAGESGLSPTGRLCPGGYTSQFFTEPLRMGATTMKEPITIDPTDVIRILSPGPVEVRAADVLAVERVLRECEKGDKWLTFIPVNYPAEAANRPRWEIEFGRSVVGMGQTPWDALVDLAAKLDGKDGGL